MSEEKAIIQIKQFINAIKQGRYQQGALVDLNSVASDVEQILVGDLHARLDNLSKILKDKNNREKIRTGKAILIILGDAVHSETDLYEMDSSIEIMQSIMGLKIESPHNVYYLLGNHDYLSKKFTKGEVFQGMELYLHLLKTFGRDYIEMYRLFIKSSPIAAIGNGFAAVHGGPIRSDITISQIKNLNSEDEDDPILEEMQWGRYSFTPLEKDFLGGFDYDINDVNSFLNNLGQKNGVLIVSHSQQNSHDWHWKISKNLHIIFAANDKCGYASVINGVVSFTNV